MSCFLGRDVHTRKPKWNPKRGTASNSQTCGTRPIEQFKTRRIHAAMEHCKRLGIYFDSSMQTEAVLYLQRSSSKDA
eukprot:6389439-Amphidinium_carterae.1